MPGGTILKKGLELTPTDNRQIRNSQNLLASGAGRRRPFAVDTVKALHDLARRARTPRQYQAETARRPGALHEYQEYLRIERKERWRPQVRDMVDKLQKALSH